MSAPGQLALARGLYGQGLSKAGVARELGISGWAAMVLLRDIQLRYPARRSRAKDEMRARARQMRAEGATYDEIIAELGVSRGSVSLWVRDVSVPIKPYDPERVALMRERRWGPTLRRREEERQRTKEAAAAQVGALSDRELLLLGVMAYWCEGAKDKPYQRREYFLFTNSDPRLIRLMLRWLDLVSTPREAIKFRIHIHETADLTAAHDYWRVVIGEADVKFERPTIKRHNPRTNRQRTTGDYHGCLVVGVNGSAELYRRIEGWFGGISAGLAAPVAGA